MHSKSSKSERSPHSASFLEMHFSYAIIISTCLIGFSLSQAIISAYDSPTTLQKVDQSGGINDVRLQKRAPVDNMNETGRKDKGKRLPATDEEEHIHVGAGKKLKHESSEDVASSSSNPALVHSAVVRPYPSINELLGLTGIVDEKRASEERITRLKSHYAHHRLHGAANLIKAQNVERRDAVEMQRSRKAHYQLALNMIGGKDSIDRVYREIKTAEAWRDLSNEVAPGVAHMDGPPRRWGKQLQWNHVPEHLSNSILQSRLKKKLARHRALGGKDGEVTMLQNKLKSVLERDQNLQLEINRIKTEMEGITHPAHSEGRQTLNQSERETQDRLKEELDGHMLQCLNVKESIRINQRAIANGLRDRAEIRPKHLKSVAKYKAQMQILEEGNEEKLQEIANFYKSKAEERSKVPDKGLLAYSSLQKHHLWSQNAGRVASHNAAQEGREGGAGQASTSTGEQRQRRPTVQQEINDIKNSLTRPGLYHGANVHLAVAEKLRKVLMLKGEDLGPRGYNILPESQRPSGRNREAPTDVSAREIRRQWRQNGGPHR